MSHKQDQGLRALTEIRKNEKISTRLQQLLYLSSSLTEKEAEYLFGIALILIDEYEKNRQKTLLIDYAYLIIARTCFKIKKFNALYDFSVNYGYYPVAKKILSEGYIPEESQRLTHVLSNGEMDRFIENGKVKTYEQDRVFQKVLNSESNQFSFIAPTSYGKSEIIFRHLSKYEDDGNVAIIVPTKALIDQTYREARQVVTDRKIIIHDQNYNSETDDRVLAIVTQERGLRLIEEGMIFSVIYIDEAHELLNSSSIRSILLSRFIKLVQKFNPNVNMVYLSPVISDSSNLSLVDQGQIEEYRIAKNLKILLIKFLDLSGKEQVYDVFLNQFIELDRIFSGSYEYISQLVQSGKFKKNLHFLFKPRDIEKYARKLASSLSNIEVPEEIRTLQEELAEIVHPEFKLIDFLSKGTVYLHGKMPLMIRNYLIKFVRESEFIKNFIANSIILAGINLPIDNLIYISGKSSQNDLVNLIGRVNRLNEIFHEGAALSKIFVPVHFVDIEEFPQPNGGKMKDKIESLRKKGADEMKNPMLENIKVTDTVLEARKTEARILELYTTNDFATRLHKAGAQQVLCYTQEGMKMLEKILKEAKSIDEGLEREELISQIFQKIKSIFFDSFTINPNNSQNMVNDRLFKPSENIKRLRYEQTLTYYKNFLKNSANPIKLRVNGIYAYWQRLLESPTSTNCFVYVGKSFGEVPYQTAAYKGNAKVYIDLRDHTGDKHFLYNTAIIKLQLDEEFVSYELMLLISTLKEFGIISQSQFDYFFYGTIEEHEIDILRLGISRTTYHALKESNQTENIVFDKFGNPRANQTLKDYIQTKKGIEKFELEQFFL
ncbi:DEAD/DEAH box helicase [Streptococcus oralis]|uniref:Helicase ATP-binding domain-containing protein n=1 Tax=Streptococcus oralis TaxID=1303 RepID=A0A139NXH9_STROR|nr:DEAD/DEAH box helicase [Streptococcus oralis]KXT80414.1 hypothetical protein SORDD15_01339 [Streptococcus oralis]